MVLHARRLGAQVMAVAFAVAIWAIARLDEGKRFARRVRREWWMR
jgi:hypothetical protein